MFRTLVKTARSEIDGRSYVARYFELRTARGSAALQLRGRARGGDRIILDDDSMTSLRGEGRAAGAGDALQPRCSPRPAVVAA